MKVFLFALITSASLLFYSCSGQSTSQFALSPKAFRDKTTVLPDAPVIDVRTPEEFSKGHLPNARNVDWNSENFEGGIASLDKAKPVFVYCLSGGRSAAAAARMREHGFKEVYEMDGGIMKWRAANLPETKGNASAKSGMTHQQFNALLRSDKLVLVDFYADWCVPCRKMKPSLDAIAKEMADNISVIRINADDNNALCKDLGVNELPALRLYKGGVIAWSRTGYITKEGIMEQLK